LAGLQTYGLLIRPAKAAYTAGTLDDKTAPFAMLETAQIMTSRAEEADALLTLAQNSGLQIKAASNWSLAQIDHW
jgi:hypothetical protein